MTEPSFICFLAPNKTRIMNKQTLIFPKQQRCKQFGSWCLQSVVCSLVRVICSLSYGVCSLVLVYCFQSSVCSLLFVIWCLQFGFSLLFVVCCLQSGLCSLVLINHLGGSVDRRIWCPPLVQADWAPLTFGFLRNKKTTSIVSIP